jgi:hypothetical protein
MTLVLSEAGRLDFRASADADVINSEMQRRLGLPTRYAPARLAIALSLGLPFSEPEIEYAADCETGKAIRGETLFGTGQQLATWMALFVQADRSGTTMNRERLKLLVTFHWSRGIRLLSDRFKAAGGDFDKFIETLVLAVEAGAREGQ